MVLVDTSVWIEVFRKRNPLRIEDLVDFDEIATCLPVIAQVLQGFREDRAFRIARESLDEIAKYHCATKYGSFGSLQPLQASAQARNPLRGPV